MARNTIQLVIALLGIGLLAELAWAQGQGINSARKKVGLDGTTWTGQQTVAGLEKFTLQFKDKGEVTLVDGLGPIQGTYKHNGGKLELMFEKANLSYKGELKDDAISGTGKNATGGNWTWKATKGGASGSNLVGGADKLSPPAKVTPETLAEFLRKQGLEPTEVTPTIGGKYCALEMKEDGWKYVIEVKVHQNGSMWMIGVLQQTAEGKRPDSDRLIQLLEANDNLAPCFFFYRAADRRMCMKLEVIAPDSQGFRNDLTRMQNAVRASRTLWSEPPSVQRDR